MVQDCIRSCLLRELTASQLVAIATRSNTGSHNRLDLIQSLVPPHYVCNGYILPRSERHITQPKRRVICLSDLGNILAYYQDKITLISLLYWVSNCPGNMPKYYPGNMSNYHTSCKNLLISCFCPVCPSVCPSHSLSAQLLWNYWTEFHETW